MIYTHLKTAVAGPETKANPTARDMDVLVIKAPGQTHEDNLLGFANLQHSVQQAILLEDLMPQDQPDMTQNRDEQAPSRSDMSPLGDVTKFVIFRQGPGHLPSTEKIDAVIAPHNIKPPTDRHDKHCEIEDLFDPMNEFFLGI